MSFERDALLSERIFDSMRDGVVAIDLHGQIIKFNDAAAKILDKEAGKVLGRPFAEEFLLDERFDDFNELVLKAVYEAQTVHSTEIVLMKGEAITNLRISSSFLTRADVNGDDERIGVVVVFSDITDQRKRRKLKRLFGEYVDPRIVEEILARGAEGVSSRNDMTISFVDMRDYTGWSERLEAGALTDLLNRFLTAVTKPISEAGGITDKFIGDAAMACWGLPFTDGKTQAADACRASLGQLQAVDALRAELMDEGLEHAERFGAVVGVATGDVLSGDIGPPSSRNFTVIGNAVNLAARLQEAAKAYGARILVSEETRERAGDGFEFRELDLITVRGSARPVKVYALLGVAGAVDEAALHTARTYEAACARMRDRAFSEAAADFAAIVEQAPDDVASALMGRRARAYADDPPPPDWDGVWRKGAPV